MGIELILLHQLQLTLRVPYLGDDELLVKESIEGYLTLCFKGQAGERDWRWSKFLGVYS